MSTRRPALNPPLVRSPLAPRRAFLRQTALLGVLGLSSGLAGCGFALRGTTTLPFESLYINLAPDSLFGAQLRRELRAIAPATRLVENPSEAEARLDILGTHRSREEIALNAQGRVQEYDLSLSLTFQVLDRQGQPLIPPTELFAQRTLPYDDSVAQAKDDEAEQLYLSMQSNLINRIVRHLNAADVYRAVEVRRAATP